MQTAHMQALETKHSVLDRRISEENLRPLPNTEMISQLKKEKLRLKDALTGH